MTDMAYAQRARAESTSDEAFFRSQVNNTPAAAGEATPASRLKMLDLLTAEYKAKGFTDKHPDVVKVNLEKEQLRQAIAREDAPSADPANQSLSFSQQSAEAERRRATLRRSAAEAEIERLQAQLRVAAKDVSAVSGLPLPEVVRMESPLFAVFSKLFDVRTVGLKEIFILAIAFFIDLGDILGYTLVPAEAKGRKRPRPATVPRVPGPERIPDARFSGEEEPLGPDHFDEPASPGLSEPKETPAPRRRARRSIRFGRRF